MKTLVAVVLVLVPASLASAEPMFLAKQYTRCAACHYSPSGGGLLTPYGRLPRTHWNVDVSYYHDHNHTFESSTSTLLAQLHLYL